MPKSKQKGQAVAERLDISIVVPTYNRPKALKQCLTSLVKQEMGGSSWEIVVVDDGSKKDLLTIVEAFEKPDLIRFFRQKNQGPAAARNYGVTMAKGEYVAFIDDDCRAAPDWLHNLSRRLSPNLIVGGRTSNALRNNLYAEATQLLIAFIYDFFAPTKLLFFASNNFALSRDLFLDAKGFDEEHFGNTEPYTSAGEDREFCVRWTHTGGELLLAYDANIQHYHSLDFSSFCKLHFKYGTGGVLFDEKMKKMGVNLQEGQDNFYNSLSRFAFEQAEYRWWKKWLICFLLLVSQIQGIRGWYKGQKMLLSSPTPFAQRYEAYRFIYQMFRLGIRQRNDAKSS